MQLSRDLDLHPAAITGIDGVRVRIGDRWLERSFWVCPTGHGEWAPQSFAELATGHIHELLAQQPELILLGTGERSLWLSPALQACALQRRCGIECMANAAAARTFNVLLGEGRAVLAAFLIRRPQT
ncbi:MAG: hypothetical protein IT479_09860 [Xanthomonadales bacterium]|nr:hypothetical protein [Xanthomonadales bacterium]MCC6593568.1 hypothetical protein [Xanthomonadales bacterium]MCE7932084.1 hypothetical protein [Xanthomonadales bacterium PRO6]